MVLLYGNVVVSGVFAQRRGVWASKVICGWQMTGSHELVTIAIDATMSGEISADNRARKEKYSGLSRWECVGDGSGPSSHHPQVASAVWKREAVVETVLDLGRIRGLAPCLSRNGREPRGRVEKAVLSRARERRPSVGVSGSV